MTSIPLNEEQQAAVNADEGAYVVISGPGTGKTSVIAQRFKRMLYAGVSPDDILTLTFTEQGAKNMAERSGFGSSQSLFRTFHSYCLALIKAERKHLPFELRPEVIPGQPDIFELVCEIRRTYGWRMQYNEIVESISAYKMRGLSPDQAVEEAVGVEMFAAAAYADYEKKSRERGWLDFDSLIIESVKLLESNLEIRDRNQLRFVQTDEAQDTDLNQFKLLQLLTQKHKNIFVIGDENQLIYEWRSAMPGSLSNFYQKFPGAKTLYLGTNYRSTKALVEFIKQIVPVDNGLATHMRPAPTADDGVAPTFTAYRDEFAEMTKVLEGITDPENTAILARTNRQLWQYENECMRRNIKFRLLGKVGFWDQGEIKKLVELLKPHKDRSGSAESIVKSVIDQSGILTSYRVKPKLGQKDPAQNIDDAYKISKRFASLSEFFTHINKATHAYRNRGGMILSTVHQMKGKEADHVYLVGCRQGLIPHEKGELSEERRIFFVACSRSIKRLHISFYGQPSMFILPFLTEEAKSFAQLKRETPGTQHGLFE